jgi:hypothetical protein
MRFTAVVAAALFVASFAVAGDAVREAAAPMSHADGGWQPSAHGGMSIRTGGEFERFSVGVEGVSELVTLTVQLADAEHHYHAIATLAAGSSHRRVDFTTLEGGHLPGDAVHAGDLSGRGVHVVDGEGHLILVGEVPHFADAPDDDPPPAEHHDEPIVARAVMQRPDGSALKESRGVVVATHGDGGDSLRCEVGHLEPNTVYVVFIGEDGAILGDVRTNGEGNAALGREAASGADLTDHLPSVAELEGRRVEVRDLDHRVVLYGHVPGVESEHDAEPVHEVGEAHDDATGADAHVVVRIRPEVGHETIRIEFHDLPHGDAPHDAPHGDEPHDGADDGMHDDMHDGMHDAKALRRRAKAVVRLADEDGVMQPVATVRVGRRGRAAVRFTTRRGGRLPLGAATLRELAGRGFDVQVGGVRAVGGNLPTF